MGGIFMSTINLTTTTANNENQSKPSKGPYVIIATVVWEFFSFFGMCALLILYLTQSLHLSDKYAYSLYGVYTSLVYLTPIIGGFVADRYLGNRLSVIIGAILIMLGHFTLAITSMWSLYFGLALLIGGVGLFKASAICLIGEYYPNQNDRNSAFMLYYIGGNIGAAIAPIICGYVAARFGFEYGFAAAGIGMFFGLCILFRYRKYLKGMGSPRISFYATSGRINLKIITIGGALLCLFLLATNFVIIELWSGGVIIIATVVAIFYSSKIYLSSNKSVRKDLRLGFMLTIVGVLFWIFVQQGGSSISLFIERFVNRDLSWSIGSKIINYTIPTAMFQAINPTSIVIFGGIIAFLLKKIANTKFAPSSTLQVIFGVMLLTLGYIFITLSAKNAELSKASMWWVISGMTLFSAAEIFIDPVILGVLTKSAPANSLSTLTAIYYLFAGAIANYLAAQVAKLTAAPTAHAVLALYKNTYTEVVYVGCAMLIILLATYVLKKCLINAK